MPLQMWDLRALEENVLKIIIGMKLNMNNGSIVDFFPLLFSLDCLMHEMKKKTFIDAGDAQFYCVTMSESCCKNLRMLYPCIHPYYQCWLYIYMYSFPANKIIRSYLSKIFALKICDHQSYQLGGVSLSQLPLKVSPHQINPFQSLS